MNPVRKFIMEWFGYSRRERRASMIIVIIIALVIIIRYVVPERGAGIEVVAFMPDEISENEMAEKKSIIIPLSLFPFDPNTATASDLDSLGIPEKVALTIVRYRNSGGVFRNAEDIRKIYGLDSGLASALIPYINIAQSRQRNDERQVVAASPPETKAVPSFKLEINGCDSADLDLLPGIGKVLSARIIRYRELLGGFISVSQLNEVYGIQDSVYLVISGMVIIDTSAVRQININIAGFRELERHPYIERYEAQSIIKYRELKGKIEGLDELRKNRILTPEKSALLRPYLGFI